MRLFALLIFLFAIACTPKQNAAPVTPAADGPTVWVKSQMKETSCESDAKALETALEKAGVKVVKTESISDGQMHAQMCGVATGNETRFQISKSDLEKAKLTGFTPVKE